MSGDSTRNVVRGDAGTVIQAGSVHLHAESAWTTPRQLPPDVAHFTGRTPELDALDAQTSGGTRPVIISAIAGVAGVGKTALAVHWAHSRRDRFPDGQLYVNLRGFSPESPLTPTVVLTGFLAALGVSGAAVPQDTDAMTGLYRSLLADRHMLVLLDNAATAEQVRALLPGSPACLVLVTSRNRLAGLTSRDGAHRIVLRELPPRDALALARDVIGPVRADAEPDATNDLVQRCAGLPLALRIAAEQVADRPHRSIAALATNLADRRLDTLTTQDDTSATIRSIFAWSYLALPASAARLFRLLSLHPGQTISTQAASAMTGMPVRPLLDTLTSGHLLTEVGPDRFQFHDLVRDFAAETTHACDTAADRAKSVQLLLTWYLRTADVARLTIYPHHGRPRLEHDQLQNVEPETFDSRSAAVEWYRQEHVNLQSALHHASQHGHALIAALLPICMATHYIRHGHWAADAEACAVGLENARRLGDEQVELVSLSAFVDALLRANRLDEAILHAERMRDIAQRLGNRRQVAGSYHVIGLALEQLEDLDNAAGCFRQALPLYRELRVQRGEAIMLGELGRICHRQGRFDDARAHLVQSLDICRSSGNSWNEALFLRHLAQLEADLGELGQAVEHFMSAARTYNECEDDYQTARTLQLLGDTLDGQGLTDRAIPAWNEALTIYESIHAPEAQALRSVISGRRRAP
ncbi:Tetratricopeptide repeat-containing protein [Lentzea waywayandensis]|uniref:Tetratricopeptide repeat-containing protein n=1 Tax=Lentzea waywayandensis TaxID=84724 RepID=A0A1I6DZF6_9PSEU|nr:tetratricopeptide repeat protein [Lentzea waywayandensis]SFR10805.1 Tetratricopeptide repeat-containing protein [Lentzea waywayandensis]